MTDVYQASPVKRHRSTKAEVEQRRQDLFDIARAMRPMTVRQVFYQATVRDLVEKSESGYTKVQTDLVQMRRGGSFLTVGWRTIPAGSVGRAASMAFRTPSMTLQNSTAKTYGEMADAYVEIWLEKDALSGVV